MKRAIRVDTAAEGALREAIARSGWLEGEQVLAAGQLRQGKAPSTLGMVTGAALIEVIRPRRSSELPRHFVLAVTPDRVVAFKASGGRGESSGEYTVNIKAGIQGSWDRAGVKLTNLTEGAKSSGGTLLVNGESVPVARPNLNGDPSTDELLEALGG